MRLVRKDFYRQYLSLGFKSKNNYEGIIKIVLKCNGKIIEESKRIDTYLSYNIVNKFANEPCTVYLYLYQDEKLVYYQNFNLIANDKYVEEKKVAVKETLVEEVKKEEIVKPLKLENRLLTTRDLALKAKAFLLEEE